MSQSPGGEPSKDLLAPASGGQVWASKVVPVPQGAVGEPLRAPEIAPHERNDLLLDAVITRRANWITCARWKAQRTITRFETSWQVPLPPREPYDNQLIYLFNGLQNARADQIIQPVLQWGVSPWGGGRYWAVIGLFVQPKLGVRPQENGLVPVQPGDWLKGYIQLIQQAGGEFIYECGFSGIPQATLRMTRTDDMVEAVAVLEAYDIVGSEDYPAQAAARMTNITLADARGPLRPVWTIEDRIKLHGQHTLPQPDGSIDIHFGTA